MKEILPGYWELFKDIFRRRSGHVDEDIDEIMCEAYFEFSI
jgi:hypothetical protein